MASRVSVVTPGFVATGLTAGNDFPMPALLTPGQAAAELVRALGARRVPDPFSAPLHPVLQLLRLLPYPGLFAAIHRITGL